MVGRGQGQNTGPEPFTVLGDYKIMSIAASIAEKIDCIRAIFVLTHINYGTFE